ncbi:SDR family NAD(P)-dependent oxidoreductase [Aquihabitans daechungensis]|uniref:SDR family NAD(P)-dependent oxidoreductase n=1 Tax=Aquihabitans daechungensis TaxID=1052257 RepID=UPI003BA21D0A
MALPAPAPDRTAVVTGASSGIGAAIARDLAGRGHGVTLVARSADKLADLAAELRGSGVRAEVLATDLTDRTARAGLLDRVTDLGLVPDLLVNNAGLSTLGRASEADPDAEMAMIELDVVAVVDLTVRFLAGMVERGRGGILNVASTAAFQPLPGQAGYGGCKAFVLSYTRSLGGELKGTDVHATALCPGPVDTGFGEAAGFDKAEAEASLPSFMWESPEAVAKSGLDALDKGHPVAIPGAANRIGATFAHLAPKRLLVPLLASRHPGLQ